MVTAVTPQEVLKRYSNILDGAGRPYELHRGRPVGDVYSTRGRTGNIKARYDLADQDNPAFANHWGNADHLSPDAANSSLIRRIMRSRSRFEVVENNPNLKGVVLTICNDFVGRGPRLRITDRDVDKKLRQTIERSWAQWARDVHYRDYLWRLAMMKMVDGEAFAVRTTDTDLEDVQLSFTIFEPEQCTTEGVPHKFLMEEGAADVDGIKLKNGKPWKYYILDYHPGATFIPFAPANPGRWVKGRYVVHWFRQDRPWRRGVPELSTGLSLSALSRRYTHATVKAAEAAASYAAVLKTPAPTWTSDQEELEEFDQIPIVHGAFLTLPAGTDIDQLTAKNPNQMYDVFNNALMKMGIRPLSTPFNIASGHSGDSNMASAVVDVNLYRGGINSLRTHAEDWVLYQDFKAWFREAQAIGQIPADFGKYLPEFRFGWDFVGLIHTDPQKVAAAQLSDRTAGFMTDHDIQENVYNRDYEEWQETIKEEQAFRESVPGLVLTPPKPAPGEAGPGGGDSKSKPSSSKKE